MSDDLQKFIVPVFVTAYGDDEHEAVEYVLKALDTTELVFEDGIFSVEVLEDEAEPYT
ncbi:MAG: hypothetical protein GTN59_08800 [Candidatus Dadabacteria bacterium]|nr:hypothetical protein [Candidatus Dadabacteria bacterium]